MKGKIHSKVGDAFDGDVIRTDIQAIFDMGYFYNVEVMRDSADGGVTLTYKVTEKPTVSEVVYRGNDRVIKTTCRKPVALNPSPF